MNYVEIARGTPFNRGIIIPISKLCNYIGVEPLYRSVYLYDESAVDYVKENGSLKISLVLGILTKFRLI